MSHESGIYEILNTVNGKRYIGSSINFKMRWKEHRNNLARGSHANRHLQAAWNKYGGAAFKFNRLLICTIEELIQFEQRCIDGYNPEYNKCRFAGSTLGAKHTDEARAKMSEARKGNTNCLGHILTAEHKANLSKARQGRKPALGMHHTDISRARISSTLRGRKKGPMSDEQKTKLSLAKKGHALSAEHCAALSESRKGNKNRLGIPHTAESLAKISAGLKAFHARKREQNL
jgi:group I intron endonuclease